MEILLVGGAVRDMLLGRPSTDRDYLVGHAAQDAFQARYPTARLVGKSFPVFILNGCEYAWPRGGSLEADLNLRDLTINALALDSRGMLHAHPKALGDLQARILRPCSPTSFEDDPVRVFRAARFAAQFPEFSPSPELLELMRREARSGRLGQQQAERVGRETLKAMAAPKPSRFLELLHATGCLTPWLAELDACAGIPSGPPKYHKKDVLGHICQVMDHAAGDPLLVWMALAHDLGKAHTPPEKWPSHHGHEDLGGKPAEELGERLRLPAAYIEAGSAASGEHMLARSYAKLRPGVRVDMLMRLEAKRLTDRIFKLEAADSADRPLDAPHPEEGLLSLAERDLQVIRQVELPDAKKNLGEKSGKYLRQMRCEALAKSRPRDKP